MLAAHSRWGRTHTFKAELVGVLLVDQPQAQQSEIRLMIGDGE